MGSDQILYSLSNWRQCISGGISKQVNLRFVFYKMDTVSTIMILRKPQMSNTKHIVLDLWPGFLRRFWNNFGWPDLNRFRDLLPYHDMNNVSIRWKCYIVSGIFQLIKKNGRTSEVGQLSHLYRPHSHTALSPTDIYH